MNPNELRTFNIQSYEKIQQFPMNEQVREKIDRLASGKEKHKTTLIPKEGGSCEHGHSYIHLSPVKIQEPATILTGLSMINDVSIYYLETG